jgi:hypothetical protein
MPSTTRHTGQVGRGEDADRRGSVDDRAYRPGECGKIPGATMVDPSLPAGLAGAVQQVFDAMKAMLGAPPVAPVPVLPPAILPAPVAGGPAASVGPPIYLGPFVLR